MMIDNVSFSDQHLQMIEMRVKLPIVIPIHNLRKMSGNNVSRFLPGIMLERQKDIFDSIFCIIRVFHFLNQFFVLRDTIN